MVVQKRTKKHISTKVKRTTQKKARLSKPKLYLKGNETFIRYFISLKPDKRRLLIKNASDKELMSLVEFIANILNNNVSMNNNIKEKLKKGRYVNSLRLLKEKAVPLSEKRQLLLQRGGFWPLLIPLLGSVVGSVVNAATRRR